MALDRAVDECEPLLPPTQNHELAEKRVTPLPKLQLSILLLLQVAEPMTSQVIYPFVNQLVSELDITGGDPKKVGYYAGLIESLFYVTEAMFVFSWSRTSDHIGRKSVLLIGLGGLCISMTLFGLSRTFWGLVVSRSLAGLLNGNIGVIKSMMGEITDSTNMAQGFAFIPAAWSAGATIGPFAGGILSHPYDRFPTFFGHQFWKDYPYLLPCLFSASFAAFAFLMALFFLNETVHKSTKSKNTAANTAQITSETIPDGPVSIRRLMTRPVMLSITNYCLIAFSEICFCALQPLFYSTSIELGGLGFDTPIIGMCLGIFGITNGVLQVLFSAEIINRFGPRQLLVIGNCLFVPIFALFPVTNQLARVSGVGLGVSALFILQLLLVVIVEMSFGAVFIFVTASAPSKRSLGSVNGVAQTTVSIARAVGPAASTSLFAFSLQTNWLGGNAAYLILMMFSCVGAFFATRLPREPWRYSNL